MLPLFAMLLPVFVLPLRSVASISAALFCAVWSVVIILRGHPTDWNTYQGQINIVDERDFWTHNVKREPGDPPRSERDFLPMRQMGAYQEGIDDLEKGDALAVLYALPREENKYAWKGVAREPGRDEPPTLYFINMGMTSMNAPLDVRVLDNIGLATPLAARQPRIENGRIGHDKDLPSYWQAALTGWISIRCHSGTTRRKLLRLVRRCKRQISKSSLQPIKTRLMHTVSLKTSSLH